MPFETKFETLKSENMRPLTKPSVIQMWKTRYSKKSPSEHKCSALARIDKQYRYTNDISSTKPQAKKNLVVKILDDLKKNNMRDARVLLTDVTQEEVYCFPSARSIRISRTFLKNCDKRKGKNVRRDIIAGLRHGVIIHHLSQSSAKF